MKPFSKCSQLPGAIKMRPALFLLLLAWMPVAANASPNISVKQVLEKEVVEKQGDKKVVKRVPATAVEPGQKLIFTIRFTNSGTSAAKNVVLGNPVPENGAYIANSATGGEGVVITFSADGGKTYAAAGRLRYRFTDSNGQQKTIKARPEHYTHVRWTVADIAVGKTGAVGYAVRVK